MKTIKLISLITVLLSGILYSNYTSAQNIYEYDGVTYELHAYGEADIYRMNGNMPDTVRIPNTIEKDGITYKVKAVYKATFRRAPMKVLIWEADEVIKEWFFMECPNLTAVEIKGNVNELEENAFQYCRNLKTVILNEGLQYIGPHCFEQCTSLEEIVLPNSLIAVLGSGFNNCTSLKKVVFKNKQLEERMKKQINMTFLNTPFAQTVNNEPTAKRKPNQAVTNDSRFKVNKKSGVVVY